MENGDNLEGKVVTFIAGEIKPQSAYGYNIYAGNHLNFVSSKNPDVQTGDIVTVKVTEINSVLGSWIIYYEKINTQKGINETTTKETTISEETSVEMSDETTTIENTTLTSTETELETETTTLETKEEIVLDYDNEEAFEKDLNAGLNLEGVTVKFIVGELHPNSAFEYNIWSGEHLNFVSSNDPNVKVGDAVIAKITSIRNVLDSWIIDYEIISVQNESDTIPSTDNSSEKNSRKIKNGFNHSNNKVYTLANYSVEIPSYWKLSDSTEVQWLYAETGEHVAMIQLSAQPETDDNYPVSFDSLYSDNEDMINSIEVSTSSTVTDYNIIDTDNIKGILYSCYSEDMGNGHSGNLEWFCFASESDRNWCSIILAQTDNTDYDYADDFNKIIQSIKATPATATTTKSNQRDYVLNNNSMKFHYPSCSSVNKISSSNRSDYTGTRDELINMGYSPCGKCNP